MVGTSVVGAQLGHPGEAVSEYQGTCLFFFLLFFFFCFFFFGEGWVGVEFDFHQTPTFVCSSGLVHI